MGNNLTEVEAKLLALLVARRSDKAIRTALGKTQNELLGLSFSLRTKLGCAMTETIRDAAKRNGL